LCSDGCTEITKLLEILQLGLLLIDSCHERG
jgi:hypothetical protein